MADKKKHSSRRSIFKFLSLVPKVLVLFRGALHKLKMEAYFTVKNIILLLMLALMLACLLTATWISLLAILFFSLLQLKWSYYAAAIIVILLNVICLIFLGIYMTKIKNRLERLK